MENDSANPAPPSTPPPAPSSVAAAEGSAPAPVTAPVEAPRVSIDDFLKLDMRVARIVAAERVPKSRKLMRVEVDLGSERRTVVAGIAEAYEPEALVGRLVAVVVNLKPATLMGIASDGMIMAASQPGGQPILVGFEREPPLGTRLK